MTLTRFSKFFKTLAAGAAAAVAVVAGAMAAGGAAQAADAGGGAAAAAAAAPAGDVAFMKGRRFAATDFIAGRISIVEADGSVSWQHPAKSSNDLWILPGGTLLFGKGNGAREVSFKDNSVKFDYTTKAEVYAVQRLPDGNTFVGECSSGRLLTLAPDGKTVVKEVALLAKKATPKRPFPGGHGFMRNGRVLANGNYLVALNQGAEAAEFNAKGEKVWSVKVPGGTHSLARLPNGHTLASGGDNDVRKGVPTALYEFDAAGKVVWKLSNDDLPGKPLRFVGGFQVLPNGNVLVCNWIGHGHIGKGVHILEVTREKKVVWTFADHKNFKTVSNVHVFGEGDEPIGGGH